MKAAAAAALVLAACGGSSGSAGDAGPPDAPPSPWSLGPTLPGRRLEPGVTALGDELVLVGGFDNSLTEGLDITSEVDVLDTAGATPVWTRLPDAPRAWTHAQLASAASVLYMLGGLDGSEYIAKGDSFAIDTGGSAPVWQTRATIPPGFERGSAGVVVAAPRIYLLGGASTNAALASNLYYDTVMDAWCPGAACSSDQQLPDLPAPRSHPAATRLADGTLVVVGGLATIDSSQPEADVWWLPVDQQNAAGHWIAKTPMPTARGGCAYGTIGGRLVCAGGEAGAAALHVVELYEPMLDGSGSAAGSGTCNSTGSASCDPWIELPDLPVARAGTVGAAVGQTLYVPGGAQELKFEPVDTLYELDLLDTGV